MKKIILITIISIASAVTAQASDHRHNDIRGVIVGAGGGALLGQAIGRNTTSTVVGTAIGSIVGYIVGTEMDRGGGYSGNVVHYNNQPVRYQHYERDQGRRYPGNDIHYNNPPVRYQHYEPVVMKPHPQTWRRSAPQNDCREAEILGTINGRAKKIYGTVCRTPDGWQLVSQDDDYDNDYRKDSRHKSKYKKDRHYSNSRQPNWVKHRF